MTERTIVLPQDPSGNGHGAQYRLTMIVPKRRFLSYLRERWWVVLSCLVLALSGVLVFETLRPPSYRSFAQLYLSSEAPVSPIGFVTEDSQDYFGTQIELLKSARLQNAVYEQLGVTSVSDKKSKIDISITQPIRTSLLNVQATGSNPDLVQHFLQSLIAEYLSYKKETRLASSEDLLSSITEQVAMKGTNLEAAQEKWTEFQRTNNVSVLEEDAKSVGLSLSDLNLQLARLRLDQRILSEISGNSLALSDSVATNQSPKSTAGLALPDSAETNETLESSSVSVTEGTAVDPVSQQGEISLNLSRVQLSELLAETPEEIKESPGQYYYDKDIARLKRQISILEENQKKRKGLQIQDLEKRITAITNAIPSLEAKLLDINQRLSQGQQIKNNIEREQAFYDHLLGTMQNVDLNKNVQQERLSVLQPATPAALENRSLPLRIALVLVGGLALSLGIVFLWYLLDDRLVSVRDIKDQFGEPVLGLVPQIRVPRGNPEKALLENEDSRTAYAESFRHLRSALLLANTGETSQSQTLLFTSAMSDEGKTTVAVNVARVLARSGLRVALVNADLHSPRNGSFFGTPDGHGLVNFLRGEVGMAAVLHSSDVPGLTIVPSGASSRDTEGLFLRPQLENLIKHLRGQSDFVILDGAPVLAADNSALLVPHADSVVLVTRPFYTRSRLIRQALDMLYQRRAKQVTIILNRARAEDLEGYNGENGFSRGVKNGVEVRG